MARATSSLQVKIPAGARAASKGVVLPFCQKRVTLVDDYEGDYRQTSRNDVAPIEAGGSRDRTQCSRPHSRKARNCAAPAGPSVRLRDYL
jgi:hypothetical protein